MATSFFALFDDIATLLDDIAILSKVAAKKTAGVLGDDLALNAQQVSGIAAAREIPVVWSVAKGSLVNKLILVPSALAISAIAPWLVSPLLVVGGAYLCFEGIEKLAHSFLHGKEADDAHDKAIHEAAQDATVDLVALEKDKIKGAIRTDFVLSAEIVVITLGSVSSAPFATRLAVLSVVSLLMTVGVYGLVAGIVKLDDLGLHLHRSAKRLVRGLGATLLMAAPKLLRLLSVVGTAAMFLVGGGIAIHGLPFLEHLLHPLLEWCHGIPVLGGILSLLVEGSVGIVLGAIVLGVFEAAMRIRRSFGRAPKRP